MSKFIGAMDKYTPATTIGENGHKQYGWVEPKEKEIKEGEIEETITQISFQLVRKGYGAVEKYKTLLRRLKTENKTGYILLLVKLCAHTRDIVAGKGEYALAYSMLDVLFDLFPDIANVLLERFVRLELNGESVHPYGSWKDIKYFWQGRKHLNLKIANLVNSQLRLDEQNMRDGKVVSLAGKWIPREKTKYGWMFEILACDYFDHIFFTAKEETRQKAINMCKMKYRKLLSDLNRHLDTTQVKQCAKKWATIVPEKVTSVTMFKNKKAFLNTDKKGNERSGLRDRIECAINFTSFLERAKKGQVEVKGKRISLADFTKEALELIRTRNKQEIDMLNLQWDSNSKQNGSLGNFVALVDVSGSMAGDPLHAAISLGIRVAEKSKLGKRVMTFTSNPTWVNLENKRHFVDMVETVAKAEWGTTTNFSKALDLILEIIVQQKMTVEEVKEISLVIFSDMMMDQADAGYNSVYHMVEERYADAGRKVHGEPYTPPHIIFWNLRATTGFPSLSKQKNTSMLSGFSPMLLNLFCEKGVDCLDSLTPWSVLVESLNNPRYDGLHIEMI